MLIVLLIDQILIRNKFEVLLLIQLIAPDTWYILLQLHRTSAINCHDVINVLRDLRENYNLISYLNLVAGKHLPLIEFFGGDTVFPFEFQIATKKEPAFR
jgi:hypothetical protein